MSEAGAIGPARGVAIFDLDGTITYRDTLLPFLVLACRQRPARWLGLWRVPAVGLRFLVDRDRGRAKGALIAALLGGCERIDVERLTGGLIARLKARGLRPGALAAIDTHRRAGDYLVLLSASPDLYVPAIGAALGFDECICTHVRWVGARLDGHLTTPNRRGEEKREVVRALLERLLPGRSAAYGNAASDLAHLELVSAPLLVNGNAAARRAALGFRIPVTDWP